MNTPRRTVLKTGALTAAALSFPSILSAQGQNAKKLKIGLVGCGGRGTGAADQALRAEPNAVLWAVGDVFAAANGRAVGALSRQHGERASVPAERQFVGLDAYLKVIAECDVVLLTTAPGYRPLHIRAAVEAGKHIFAEKPMAVDMAGVKSVLESAKIAKQKGLSIQHGYCWRFAPGVREAFARLHQGEIGNVRSIYGTYLASPPKTMMPASSRKPETADVEWQIMNWINFRWLSGGPLLEQAIHTVDKVAWAMKDVAPIAAVASGGLSRPEDGGNIFDHYNVAYEYPGGVVAHVGQRQWVGAHGEVVDRVYGEKGTLICPNAPTLFGAGGRWKYQAKPGVEQNMYQVCHNEFFAALREGKRIDSCEYMMNSTALGILGREAAFSGKRITWEALWNSDQDVAAEETLKLSDAFPPAAIPRPNQYKFS